MGSASSKMLANNIRSKGYECLRVYPDRRYRPRPNDMIVNWGFGGNTNWDSSRIEFNKPSSVELAVNKYTTLTELKKAGISIPEFTTDSRVASGWDTIYTRHNLCSSGGRGIAIFRKGDILPLAPLYTKGIKVKAEYRVHVFKGEIIDYTKKINQNADDEQSLIRNHTNGFMFIREGIERLERIEDLAIQSVKALGLDFGGVDIVMDTEGKVYTLEVNTACGIAETALENYTNNIIKYA